MAKYAILKYSTDMRYPKNRITFTTSRAAALEAIKAPAVFTYGDPEAARNYHHDLTAAYELPTGWKKPTKKQINEELFRRRGSIYSPRFDEDIIAEHIRRDGEALGG